MERSRGSDEWSGHSPHSGTIATAEHPPLPTTVADARHQVQDLLRRSGFSRDTRAVTDALMVTSELVTNAVRHGDGLTDFRADVHGGVLRLSVADRNPGAPLSRTSPTAVIRIGGYGWPLVQSLAHHLTITPSGNGKRITVDLNLH
ncbi:ATP-binding protein [Streptomyces sp. NPDC058623]|uniref:ATP-binding protein n=1 Tax=Streptomyces sp. NPDC058623 TaxID=3346563 RepID=UPI003656735E